jgi:RHS repeat-associated protein
MLLGVLLCALWSRAAYGQLDRPLTAPPFPGLGQAGSVGHLASVGTVSEGIALQGAPGRKGFEPHAALLYNSAGGLGDSGVGWQLEFGRIERSSRDGSPALSQVDKFDFHLAGTGAELVPIGGGEYRARIEGVYRRFTRVADRWEVRDASGNLYVFGETDATRVTNQIWMLHRIVDPNGNTIAIDYRVDAGSFYPSVVHYTGYAPTGDPGANEIRFEYEPRDDKRLSYLFGIEQRRALRLTEASFFAEGALVRRYALTYAPSPANLRSLVTAIDHIASDESSVRTRSYSYRIQRLGFGAPDDGHQLPYQFYDGDGHDRGGRTADVNGDTYLDVLDNGQNVWLGDGTGVFTLDSGWSTSLAAANVVFVGSQGIDAGTRLVDVNGDQRPDLVVASSGARRVLLNTGSGWMVDSAYTTSLQGIEESVKAPRSQLGLPCNDAGVEAGASDAAPPCGELTAYQLAFSFVQSSGDSSGVVPVDVNGDGLLDFVWSYQTTDALFEFVPPDGSLFPDPPRRATANVRAVYLNNGHGWSKSPTLSTALESINPFVVNTQLGGYDVLDVNGDGIADIINTSAPSGADNRVVLLGTGTGWVANADYTDSLKMTAIVSLEQSKSQGLVPIDFNGDGLIDYFRADESTKIAYRNTGLGWVEDPRVSANLADVGLEIVNGDGVPHGFLFADVNGDGITDLLQSKQDGGNLIRYALGPAGDLLTHVGTALGETFDLVYDRSSRFDNRGTDGLQHLPLVLNVLTSITRSAGRGVLVGGTFTYAGGLYEDRNLRGFARTDSVDFQGVRAVTSFQQSEPLAGQPSKIELFDATGLRRRTSLGYALANPVTGITQVRPIQTDLETFDPGGSIHTRMRMAYDDFLNVTELAKEGDVDIPSDDARTVFTYATNPAVGIVNTVARTRVLDAGGTLRSESTVFYDDLPEGQVVRGNPTKFVDSSLAATEPDIVRTSAYDPFGNPNRLTDAAGSVSTIEYSHQGAFKSKATDPLGRIRLTETDARFGVVTRETDPNGQVITRSYDAAGRLVRETLPGDETSPFGTRTITYSPLGAGQFFRIAATEEPGKPGTLDTVAFVDGFGRIDRVETEGAAGHTVVVTLEYDDRGNVAKSSFPFFAGDPAPLVITARDALQRVVRQTQPDGTFDETHYSGKQRETIDRRGNRTVFVDDAQGNTIETRQFAGGATLVTQRRYDIFSHLVETTDPMAQVTRIAYDGHGRRIRLEDPNAGTNQYVYDVSGNLVRQIDAAGRTTEFDYNRDGEIVLKKLPTGQVISYQYGSARDNAVGRLAHVEDAAGKLDIRYDGRGQQIERERTVGERKFRTRYEYDSLGRTRAIEYPDGFKVNYHFDEAGLVDRITDRNDDDVVSLIEHNALGRPTELNFANGVQSGFIYDLIGFTRSISTQDRRGRSLQNLIYDYDAEGNVTSITNFDDASRSQAFEYDEIQRLAHAVGGYGDQIYRYDAGSTLLRKGNLVFQRDDLRRQQVTCAIDLGLADKRDNGVGNDPGLRACATELASPAGGLSADEQAKVATILAKSRRSDRDVGDSLLLTYDNLGNLSTKTGQLDDFDHARDDTRSFVYDAENRLLRIVSKDDHSGHENVLEENLYDAGGQRIVRTIQLEGNGKDDETTIYIDGIFEIDSKHRARHIKLGTLVLATSTTPFGLSQFHGSKWDDPVADTWSRAACACSTWGRETLSWVHGAVLAILAGILISRSARVRRSARGVRRGITASTVSFWRRPITVITALLMVGIQLANMGWSRRSEADDSHFDPGEKRFYYHSDHLGNTNVITDEHASEVVRREYAPFGEQFVRDGQRDLEISFNGHLFDKQVGLYYFGARHYDPALGRFITPDSIVPDSSPQALHRYALNLNNPIRFVDPTGHDFWDVFVGVIVAVVLVAATIVTLGAAGVLAGAILTAVAIGAGIGAVGAGIAALYLADKGIISSFWEGFSLTLVGGLVGAATGGTVQLIASAATTALPAGSTIWSVFASHAGIFALGGAAVGGGAGAGVAIAHGSYDLVLLGWFFGAAIGAAVGLFSGIGLSQGILSLQGVSGFAQFAAVAKLVGSAASAAALVLATGYEGTRRLLKVLFKSRNFDKYKLPDRFLEVAIPLLAAGTFLPFIPPTGGEQPALATHPGAN